MQLCRPRLPPHAHARTSDATTAAAYEGSTTLPRERHARSRAEREKRRYDSHFRRSFARLVLLLKEEAHLKEEEASRAAAERRTSRDAGIRDGHQAAHGHQTAHQTAAQMRERIQAERAEAQMKRAEEAFNSRISHLLVVWVSFHVFSTLVQSALCFAAYPHQSAFGCLFYFLWDHLWAAPMFVFTLLLSIVCEVHVLDYEAIIRYVQALIDDPHDETDEEAATSSTSSTRDRPHELLLLPPTALPPLTSSGSLPGPPCIAHVAPCVAGAWQLCVEAHARLSETSVRFNSIALPAAFTLAAFVCILGSSLAASTNEMAALSVHSPWILLYLFSNFVVLMLAVVRAARIAQRVTELNLEVHSIALRNLQRAMHRTVARGGRALPGCASCGAPSAERHHARHLEHVHLPNIERLQSYLETLQRTHEDGLHFFGVRIDFATATKFATITLLTGATALQRTLSHVPVDSSNHTTAT